MYPDVALIAHHPRRFDPHSRAAQLSAMVGDNAEYGLCVRFDSSGDSGLAELVAHRDSAPRSTLLHVDDNGDIRVVRLNPSTTLELRCRTSYFDRLARRYGVPTMSAISVDARGVGGDTLLTGLTGSLAAALAAGYSVSAGHLSAAIVLHCVFRDADTIEPLCENGGLAPWQLERALAMLQVAETNAPAIETVAQACRLSVSHFRRSFTRTMGLPPQRWVARRKLERAKVLLSSSDARVTDIAYKCGFSDQSHFTRVFARSTGLPPKKWRRDIHGRSESSA